jgi:hypothetical protein
MARTQERNVRGTDALKNSEAEIILQKKEGTSTYKIVRHCGDGPCGDGGQRLEKKNRGHIRL